MPRKRLRRKWAIAKLHEAEGLFSEGVEPPEAVEGLGIHPVNY